MLRLNALSVIAGVSLGLTLLAVWIMALCSGLNWTLRVEMVGDWLFWAYPSALLLTLLSLSVLLSPRISGSKDLYRRVVPAHPSGQIASVRVWSTPGWVCSVVGGITLALGLKMMISSLMKGASVGLATSGVAWLTVAIGLLLIGFRYDSRVDAAGGRLLQTFRLAGLGWTRRKEFGPSVKVRLREEISQQRNKSSTTHIVHSHYLEVVDGDKVMPISHTGSPAAAENLAAHLQKPDYEHLICDYTGTHPPENAEKLESVPGERLSGVHATVGLVCAFLILLLPYLYGHAIQAERNSVDAGAKEKKETYLFAMATHELEDKHSSEKGPLTPNARGDYQSAVANWERLLKDDPENPEYVLGRGRVRLKLGMISEGLADVDRFRQLKPEAWRDQGSVQSSIYELPPNLLAESYLKNGEAGVAVFILEKHQFSDRALLGLAFIELGKWDHAQEALEEARTAIQPNSETIAALEKRLQDRPE